MCSSLLDVSIEHVDPLLVFFFGVSLKLKHAVLAGYLEIELVVAFLREVA